MNKEFHNFLGIALKAGKIVSGDDTTLLELKKGKLKLVIIANDASDNTKKMFEDKCAFKKVKYVYASSKVDLGLAMGKYQRAVIGVKDMNFAIRLQDILEKAKNNNEINKNA